MPQFQLCSNFCTFLDQQFIQYFQSSKKKIRVCVFLCKLKFHQEGGSGLNQLLTKKLGTKDLSVYICHRKAAHVNALIKSLQVL